MTNKIAVHIKYLVLVLLILYTTENKLIAQQLLSRKITVSFKNKSIEEFIRYLQNYEGIAFSYSKNLVQLDKKVSGYYQDIELKTVLDNVFEQSSVTYRYKSGIIVLLPKPQNLNQLIIKGKLKAANDSLPVEFAGIQLNSSGKGTISDMNGNFSMIIKKENLNDSISISSLGFEKTVFPIDFFTKKNERIIYLNRRIIKLQELQVKAGDYKNYTSGNKKKIARGSVYIDTQGQQTARYIENKKARGGTISSVSFYLSRKGNTNSAFRIRIYKRKTLSKMPGEDILKEVIIAKPKIKGGWFKVDLSQFHIEVPEDGFFVAIEGIYPYDYLQENSGFQEIQEKNNHFLQKSVSYGQSLGYSRKKGKNTWHYSLAHTWFQLNENNYDVMISAEIQIRKNK